MLTNYVILPTSVQKCNPTMYGGRIRNICWKYNHHKIDTIGIRKFRNP